ncbi:MAG: LysM domain [Gaiellaceae bacterium]|nr:LysM domain [Gaiellaceae bacterium]
MIHGHERLARYAAPAAFLVAATIAVLLVRAGLGNSEPATVPVTTPVTPATATESAGTTTDGSPTAPAGSKFYVIQAGDTLAVIADQYDTSVEQLLVLNPDIDPVALTVGQRIRVK